MRDFGTVRPGTTLYIPFATYDSNDPSASVTLTGLATTDIEIYKDGSTTQRGSDNGYALLDTDGIDFDGVTGIHGISIDLADNTTAGFYAAGSQYWVVVASVTVDSGTINFIAATFRIGYESAILNTTIATLSSQTSFTLTSGPAEDDALNGMEVVIHDVASAVQMGRAVISDYTGSSKTVTLAAGTTFTAAATDNIAVMGPSPVQPTVAGRTLDVTATGAAGIDWGNVENQGTSVSLTSTTLNAIASAVSATLANGAHGGSSASFEFGDGGVIGSISSAGLALYSNTDAALLLYGAGVPGLYAYGSSASAVKAERAGAGTTAVEIVGTETVSGGVTVTGTLSAGTLSATTNSVPWNAAYDAEVQSECDDALAARGVTTTRTGYLDNLSAGAVATAAKLLSYFQSALRKDVTVDTDIGGNYDDATDSQEAIRDRGDAAWTTATGFSTHSAADIWSSGTRTLTAIDEDSTTLDLDATVRAAVGMSSANLDTQLGDLPTAAENATAVLTTQMTEAYAADGTAPTLAQMQFMLWSLIAERSISSVTMTCKKLDGSTTAMTFTLDDATTPTAITRAT